MSLRPLALAILFYFTTVTAASAQNLDTAAVSAYYRLKNKAELLIVDSQYAKALSLYKEAFRYKTPDGTDVFNALIMAYYTGDTASAITYCNNLASHGMTRDAFLGSDFGKMLAPDDPLLTIIMHSYDSLRAVCLASSMPRMASILDRIMDHNFNTRNMGLKDIDGEDAKDIDSLVAFIKLHGFPGYEMVGVLEKHMITVGSFSTFSMVLWHARNQISALNELGLAAVRKGAYPPIEYALYSDMVDPKYYMILPERVKGHFVDSKDITEEDMNEERINKARADIYLDNLDDYRKKIVFQQTHPQFPLIPAIAMMFNMGR